MIKDRVPFDLAVRGEKLLKKRWDTLSSPQKTVLKAFYGLTLTDEELVHWSVMQGGATYDELGVVKTVTLVPYTPKEYTRLVPILGRRSGKTDRICSTAAAYELTCGGHKQYSQDQDMLVPFVAQTIGDAERNMAFIRTAIEESPLLKQLLVDQDLISKIEFKDKTIVEARPANKALGRGMAIPVVILDENAFWYTDPNAANPDYEVVRAVSYSQAQFPFAKQFLPTTPWVERGIAYNTWKAGTEGRKLQCDACKGKGNFVCEHPLDERDRYTNVLMVHASTMAMQNPLISRKRIIEIRRDDPDAFPRESLALFIKSISGWLNHAKIALATDSGVTVRPREPRHQYVAAIDPAFRKDSFAFTICHHEPQRGIVQDYLRYWTPEENKRLKPGEILDDIKEVLDLYGIDAVVSDQYQLESLQQLALDRKFTINGFDFTGKSKAKITGSFKTALDQERVKLLDNELQKDQLESLQRQVLQSDTVRIAAPVGKHDDVAMVLILCCRQVVWLITEMAQEEQPAEDFDRDHVKIGLAQIERKRDEARRAMLDEDD
jgi:hypothetical protein